MEKYCKAGRVTDDNIIWHMRRLTKSTDTHSEYASIIPGLRTRLGDTLYVHCLYCILFQIQNTNTWRIFVFHHQSHWSTQFSHLIRIKHFKLLTFTILISVDANYWGGGTRGRSWLRHCATCRNYAGSIPDGVIKIFYSHNPSGRTMAVELTQPLTEMSTRNISWVVKAAGV